MYITTNKQLEQINSLICEGIDVQKSTIVAKKNYLNKVVDCFKHLCEENNIDLPLWVETFTNPVIQVSSNSDVQIDNSYVSSYVIQAVELLKHIESDYYNRQQIDKLNDQIVSAKQQVENSRNANCISIAALAIAILIPIILAKCVPTKIELDNTQCETLIEHLFQQNK